MRFGAFAGVSLLFFGCAHAQSQAPEPAHPAALTTTAVFIEDTSYAEALDAARAAGERVLKSPMPVYYAGDESAWSDFAQLSFAPWIRRSYADLDAAHDAYGRATSRAYGNEERAHALSEWADLDAKVANRLQLAADNALTKSGVESEPRDRFIRSVTGMIEPLRSRARERSGITQR